MRSVARLMVITLFLGSALLGCKSMTGETAGQNFDDTGITTSVKAKLAKDEGASTVSRVSVKTEQGVVYLNGIVPDESKREQAAQLASEVNGVRRVVNNLQIERPS